MSAARLRKREAARPLRLRGGEADFVRCAPQPAQAGLCAALALACNRLDLASLRGRIAPAATLLADEAAAPVEGEEALLAWLGARLERQRALGPARLMRAELARSPGDGRPCVLIHRRPAGPGARGLGERVAWYRVDADGQGRMARLQRLTGAPTLRQVRGSGLFPGVAPWQLRREREYALPRLPRDAGFVFRLFELESDAVGNRIVEDAVAACLGRLPGSVCRIHPVRPLAPNRRELEQDLQRYAVTSYPTLVVEHRGALVARLVGAWGPRRLERLLREYVQ